MASFAERSLALHRKHRGKLAITSRVPIETADDLSLAYTPGVARPCEVIRDDPSESFNLTLRGNAVAVLSDGSAVLGLGNIGPEAALPVMEGKAILFKRYADIDAFPLCVRADSAEAIIAIAKAIAPTFGGINLEDIRAPRCFVVEDALQDLGIPVFHDDQHGTAIVLLAALHNAARVVGKQVGEMKIVINGAGAAGTAIAKILRCVGHAPERCVSVRGVIICDSHGILSSSRPDLPPVKQAMLAYTNRKGVSGMLADALVDADAFIGVSVANALPAELIARMAPDPIILAMANPVPEIMPEAALAAGAAVVGTGRSDFPNQVNNVLAFPGIFRGALDARAPRITGAMKLAAVRALAGCVPDPTADRILPAPTEAGVCERVAAAVRASAGA